jgi:hypothetical protein
MSLKTYPRVIPHSKEMLTAIFKHTGKSFPTRKINTISKIGGPKISLPYRQNTCTSVTEPTVATEMWEISNFLRQRSLHIDTELHHTLCNMTGALCTCIQLLLSSRSSTHTLRHWFLLQSLINRSINFLTAELSTANSKICHYRWSQTISIDLHTLLPPFNVQFQWAQVNKFNIKFPPFEGFLNLVFKFTDPKKP